MAEVEGAGRSATGSGPGTMSIGEVLAELKPEFDDISVSKIRFLEAAGLLHPERAPSGYRKFTQDDLARLRFILRAQRDQYLPLRVIRERLSDLESSGSLLAAGAPDATVVAAAQAAQPKPAPIAADPAPAGGPSAAARAGARTAGVADLLAAPEAVQFGRAELCSAAGADEARLAELESFGLIAAHGDPARGGWYDGDDLVLLRLAEQLAGFGLEARHLRMYRSFAERETALFEQVAAPLAKQRAAGARTRARTTLGELAELGVRMHAAALRRALEEPRGADARP